MAYGDYDLGTIGSGAPSSEPLDISAGANAGAGTTPGESVLGGFGPVLGAGAWIAGGIIDYMGVQKEQKAAAEVSKYSSEIAGLEKQINEVKRTQMNVQTWRQQMENLRNTQRTLSLSKLTAAGQTGSLQGSGYAGGRAGIEAQGATNALGLAENQYLGNQAFDLTSTIGDLRMRIAAEQRNEATGAGMASLGTSLMSGASNLAKFTPA